MWIELKSRYLFEADDKTNCEPYIGANQTSIDDEEP